MSADNKYTIYIYHILKLGTQCPRGYDTEQQSQRCQFDPYTASSPNIVDWHDSDWKFVGVDVKYHFIHLYTFKLKVLHDTGMITNTTCQRC